MKINQIAKIHGGQDGAIWKNELFRFDDHGRCYVHNLLDIDPLRVTELEPFTSFVLDRSESIVPHSNAVCFGSEYYAPGDEFPLLYSNIYNNYSKAENKQIGVCCVYRLVRRGDSFDTTLVQIIEIGFCDDHDHWRAYPDRDGKRPYGNFVIDRDTGTYYAFVMRSEELGTRYFKFDLPSVADGDIDPVYGVKRVVLGLDDIRDEFDCPYHRFIQGATVHKGKIYSTEGFDYNETDRPAIRVIAPILRQQEMYVDLMKLGYSDEAEMIDFYNGVCYYSDAHGGLYVLNFEVEDR